MKFSQILNELQGISLDARVWAPIIKSSIKLSKNSPEPIIIGQHYPKEYQRFPVDYIHFKIDPNYGNGAGYDEQKSGYKDDRYHIYFAFGPYASDSAINHELKHAFEDYMRISRGHKPLKSTKEAVNYFGGDFEKMMMSPSSRNYLVPFSTLIEGLYYTSKIERSAFSDTVYDNPNSRSITDHISTLVNYADATRILKKNNPEVLQQKWNEFKQSYHIVITDKFDNYEEFIKWACDEIQYKGKQTLKKLLKVKYFGKQNNKKGDK